MAKKTTYLELIEKFEDINAQLIKNRLWPKSNFGRYQFYGKLIKGLQKSIEDNSVPNFLRAHSPKGEAMFALKQIYELNVILEFSLDHLDRIKDSEKQKFSLMVKEILSGPNFTNVESTINSRARNIQFELLLAYRLYSKGYKNIDFLVNPDLLVESNKRIYGFECKRVLENKEDALLRLVGEATNQIINNTRIDILTGIVALDLTNLFEKDIFDPVNNNLNLERSQNLLGGKDDEAIKNFAQDQIVNVIQKTMKRTPKLIKSAKKGKVVAVIGSLSCVYAKNKSETGWIHEISVFVFDTENPLIAQLFTQDFSELRGPH